MNEKDQERSCEHYACRVSATIALLQSEIIHLQVNLVPGERTLCK